MKLELGVRMLNVFGPLEPEEAREFADHLFDDEVYLNDLKGIHLSISLGEFGWAAEIGNDLISRMEIKYERFCELRKESARAEGGAA